MDLIDEHVDHLNYLQDIYLLPDAALSERLSEQLLRRLLVPVHLASLLAAKPRRHASRLQPHMALFALAHLFAVVRDRPLLNHLCELIFFINDEKVHHKHSHTRSYSILVRLTEIQL